MPYGKTPMKKKGSMMHMGHSPAEMGHSPMKNVNKGYAQEVKTPVKMGHSPLTKHCTSALRYKTPMKMENVIDRDAKSSGKNQYDKYGK